MKLLEDTKLTSYISSTNYPQERIDKALKSVYNSLMYKKVLDESLPLSESDKDKINSYPHSTEFIHMLKLSLSGSFSIKEFVTNFSGF